MKDIRFQETWFYAPHCGATDHTQLPEEEAHHALRVLRLKEGVTLTLTDGKGMVRQGSLVFSGKNADVVDLITLRNDPAPEAEIALALLKGRDLEIPVEGLCELPLKRIQLLRTEHDSGFAEQDHSRLIQRLLTKSMVALKQSKKAWQTEIMAPIDFKTWMADSGSQNCILAHPGKTLLPNPYPKRFSLAIGPEGGFSDQELQAFSDKTPGYQLDLGPTRLRAIHAPLFALGMLLGHPPQMG